MDKDVTIFFTTDGVLLLRDGMAETVYPKEGGKPIAEALHDAMDAGVKFVVCTAAMGLHDLGPEDLIQGVQTAGGATMWQLASESQTVLSF